MEDPSRYPSVYEPLDDRLKTYSDSLRAFERYKRRHFDGDIWDMGLIDQTFLPSAEESLRFSQRLGFNGDEAPWLDHPAMYVIVPVSLLSERPGNVTKTLDLIDREAELLDGPIDVLIWANMDVPANLSPDLYEDKGKHYRDNGISISLADYVPIQYLRAMTREADILAKLCTDHMDRAGILPDDMRVYLKTAVLLPTQKFNEIRHDSVLTVASTALQLQVSFKTPVTFLDSDTTFIKHGSLARVTEALRNREAHFVRAGMVLTNNREMFLSADMPDARKVAVVMSIARRMIEQNLGPQDPMNYVDESGLAMTIETWLKAGGNDTADPNIGESRSLLARAREACEQGILDPSIPVLSLLDHRQSRIGNSNRRFHRLAASLPAYDLPGTQCGDDYVDSQSMGQSYLRRRLDHVREAEVTRMVDIMASVQEELFQKSDPLDKREALTPDQRKRIQAIIARCAFER